MIWKNFALSLAHFFWLTLRGVSQSWCCKFGIGKLINIQWSQPWLQRFIRFELEVYFVSCKICLANTIWLDRNCSEAIWSLWKVLTPKWRVKFTRAFDERVFTRRRYRSIAKNFGAESYVPKNAREVKNEACTAIRQVGQQYFVDVLLYNCCRFTVWNMDDFRSYVLPYWYICIYLRWVQRSTGFQNNFVYFITCVVNFVKHWNAM